MEEDFFFSCEEEEEENDGEERENALPTRKKFIMHEEEAAAAQTRPPAWLAQARRRSSGKPLSFLDRAKLAAAKSPAALAAKSPAPQLAPTCSTASSAAPPRSNRATPSARATPATRPTRPTRPTTAKARTAPVSRPKDARLLARSDSLLQARDLQQDTKRSSSWSAEERKLLKETIARGTMDDLQTGGFWTGIAKVVGRPAADCARETIAIEERRLDTMRRVRGPASKAASLADLRAKIPSKGNCREWRVQQFLEKAAFNRQKPQDLLSMAPAPPRTEPPAPPRRRSSATPLWDSKVLERTMQSFKTGLTPRPSLTGREAEVEEIVNLDKHLTTAEDPDTLDAEIVPDLLATGTSRSLALQRFADRHRRKAAAFPTTKRINNKSRLPAGPLASSLTVQSVLEKEVERARRLEKKEEIDNIKRRLRDEAGALDKLEIEALQNELCALEEDDGSWSEDYEDT